VTVTETKFNSGGGKYCSTSCRAKQSIRNRGTEASDALAKGRANISPEARASMNAALEQSRTSENQSIRSTTRNYKMWSDDKYRKKMSELSFLRSQNPENNYGKGCIYGIKGVHQSDKCEFIPFDSYLERDFFRKLDNLNDVETYSRPSSIRYFDKNSDKFRTYNPDVLINYSDGRKEVVEIKPSYLLKDTEVLMKADIAKSYLSTLKTSFRFVTENDVYT
jgi:hypothetical protein